MSNTHARSTTFDERERAAEYGFAHSEEMRFLAARDGLTALGLWAAGRMGLAGPAAAAYADALTSAFVAAVPIADLGARVRDDLARAGAADAAGETSAMLDRLTAEASARRTGVAAPAPKPRKASPATASVPDSYGLWDWRTGPAADRDPKR